MKDIFKKITSLLLIFATLFNSLVYPAPVYAASTDKGDLKLVTSDGTQYVKSNNESVYATEGSYTNPGDLEVRKTVKKLDNNGNYEVIFEARGKRNSSTTNNTVPVYAVIVFDRSNSMNGDTKWSNAKTGAKTFATKLIEKYSNAKIAMVTFGTSAQTTTTKTENGVTTNFINSDFSSYSDSTIFGNKPNGTSSAGGTNLHAGLIEADRLLSSSEVPANAKKYIVVISDGAPTYYVSNSQTTGNGSYASNDLLKATFGKATELKTTDNVEIFTIGYSLPTKNVCYYTVEYFGKEYEMNNCSGNYANYTPEKVLKEIATNESHYVSADPDSVVNAFNNIVGQTTVYQPAVTNLVITDYLGDNFTSTTDTDGDGVITLPTLAQTTILDTTAWQEVGRFRITIDPDSETAWHNTNNNFTYTYDGLETPITSTKNPQVYWVQPTYGYRIEYYYNDVLDNSKTESGQKYKDETVQVLDTSIEANIKTGYKFSHVDPESKQIIIQNGENVIKVYYVSDESQTKDLSYTVEYYKNGALVSEDTQIETTTVQVLEPDTLTVDKTKINIVDKYYGYKFVGSNPETIPDTINNGGVIKIYYETDEKQTKDLSYTVEYYKNGVLVSEDTQVETTTVQVLEPDTLTVDKTKINIVDKYVGYKFVGSNPETIPDTINDGGVIKIYYEKDEFAYTIEYYYNGVKDDSKTENSSATFEEIITTYEDKVIDGYKLEKTENLPLTIGVDTTKNIISVYYVKDEFAYTVEYYYSGVKDNNKTENSKVTFEEVITTYEDKVIDGYKLEKVENLPLTITSNPNENVIKVYYEKDEFAYTIEYYYDGVKDDSKTENSKATFEEVITTYIDKNITGYKLEKEDNLPLTITSNPNENVIKIYYVKNNYGYKVQYYYDGLLDDSKTEISEATFKEVISTYTDKVIDGYKLEKTENLPLEITSNSQSNVIKVYYVKDEFGYTVEYYYDGVIDSSKTETSEATFKEVISTYTDKVIDGYKLEKTENLPLEITSNSQSNVIKVYYVKDEFSYKIQYYYDGLLDDAKTEISEATFKEVISTYTDKVIDGYKLEKTENLPLEITSNSQNNVIKVYYVKDEFGYTVEYYKENINGEYVLVDEDTVLYENVEYGTKVEFIVNEYENYTYDETKTENADANIPANNDLVVRLYYNLDNSSVIVHYVVKVGDNYIPFTKYGRDELGNKTDDFKDVVLEDEVISGKIGSEFTTEYRYVSNYTFIGLYEGNISTNSDLIKLEGNELTGLIESEIKEYTYIYEAPLGDSEELPPQTGVEFNMNYLNYILLISVIYVLRKYFKLINTK